MVALFYFWKLIKAVYDIQIGTFSCVWVFCLYTTCVPGAREGQ